MQPLIRKAKVTYSVLFEIEQEVDISKVTLGELYCFNKTDNRTILDEEVSQTVFEIIIDNNDLEDIEIPSNNLSKYKEDSFEITNITLIADE